MPLEIRELTIKVNVTSGNEEKTEPALTEKIKTIKAEILSECFEMVMDKVNTSANR